MATQSSERPFACCGEGRGDDSSVKALPPDSLQGAPLEAELCAWGGKDEIAFQDAMFQSTSFAYPWCQCMDHAGRDVAEQVVREVRIAMRSRDGACVPLVGDSARSGLHRSVFWRYTVGQR